MEISFTNTSKRSSNKAGLIASIVFMMIGLSLLTGFVIAYQNEAHFLSVAKTVPGKVVAFTQSTDGSSGDTMYSPVFQYTLNGKTYTAYSNSSSSSPDYSVGEKVVMAYDPANPANGSVDDGGEQWALPSLLLVMGLIFFLIGILCFILRSKEGRLTTIYT